MYYSGDPELPKLGQNFAMLEHVNKNAMQRLVNDHKRKTPLEQFFWGGWFHNIFLVYLHKVFFVLHKVGRCF